MGYLQAKSTFEPTESLKVISFADHYVPMKRVFDLSRKYVWAVNGVISASCFVAFVLIPGKEVVFSLYIPLDLILNVCKMGFYWFHYFKELSLQEAEENQAKLF